MIIHSYVFVNTLMRYVRVNMCMSTHISSFMNAFRQINAAVRFIRTHISIDIFRAANYNLQVRFKVGILPALLIA